MANEFSFEADDKTIKEILFGQRKFRVPRYQRPYAWGLEEAAEFWMDLTTNQEPYFMGSFVFCTENEKTTGFTEIIDGQQRLLTITIFMSVLRDLAGQIDKETAQRIQRQDIAIEDREGKQSFRLIPDESIAPFIGEFIQTSNPKIKDATASTVEQGRVLCNYDYFYKRIQEILDKIDSNKAKLDRLIDLRKQVGELVVVDIELAREEDAYEIFETTNARGIDLSVSDLLKNLIFSKMPASSTRDTAKEKWVQIGNNILASGSELRRFIRYYWLSKYSFVTEKRLYREIRNTIKDWNVFLDDLYVASEIYNSLIVPDESNYDNLKNGDKIYDSLLALSLMDVSQCYVLLLSIIRNIDKLGMDPTRIIGIIEKFTFMYSVVCKLPTNKIEKIYSRCSIDLETAIKEVPSNKLVGTINSILAKLEDTLRKETPRYAVFRDSFDGFCYKNSEKSRSLIKYALDQIDKQYGTREYKINFNIVNIEHILPQNPDLAWGLSRSKISPYVNLLGNLTLLSEKINSKVQNKIVSEKLSDFKNSEIAITKLLVADLEKNGHVWGKDQIYSRQEDLAKLSYDKIWAF
jgi:uncharacterized protein with ParB-like and HNH nuclease domain